jgi:uncharacterized protein (TIGR00369 family)
MATFLELAREMIDGRRAPAPMAALVGFRLTHIEEGRSRFEMIADERLANPMGTLHGGALCDVADAAMGVAYGSTLQEGESFTTLELKINFLRPVWRATLIAEGSVVQRGRTVGLTECTITDEKGRLVAKATSTCLTLRGEQASGR